MCTEYGGNYKGIASITVPVMKYYCYKHGYEFRELILERTGNDYAYKKIEFIIELFEDENIKAVFYIDADAMPTNHTIKVESFMDEEHDLFITEHLGEINGGSLIIKNTKKAKQLLNKVLHFRSHFDNEQNVINFCRYDSLFKESINILPHPSINSFDYRLYVECPEIRKEEQGHWVKGCFVFHVPALGIQKREEVLTNIKQHIIYE